MTGAVVGVCDGAGTCNPWRYMFTTANAYSSGSDFMSPGAADNICDSAARSGGMAGLSSMPPTKWMAWLSTSTVNAFDRFASVTGSVPTLPWFMRTSTGSPPTASLIISPSALQTTSVPPLMSAPRYGEGGTVNTSTNAYAWTGTGMNGAYVPTETCGDWTVATGSGVAGSWNMFSTLWNESDFVACGSQAHLYCFQQ